MPDPPASSLLTRYVFENPWPVAGVCVAVAIVLLWMGLREGRGGQVIAGGVAGLIGGIVALLGMFIVTAGEHAHRVTAEFVDAVVASDLTTAKGLLASSATLNIGSPTNPGFSREFIIESLERVSHYAITSNSKSIDGFSRADDAGSVHLRCWTDVQSAAYLTPSNWVIEVERDTADQWKINRITCISIAGSTPDARMW